MKNKTYQTTTRERGRPFLTAAAVLALAAATSVVHADTVVDNLPAVGVGGAHAYGYASSAGQIFTMPDSGDDILSSITLNLDFAETADGGSATVDLYDITGDGSDPSDWTEATTLGTVSAASAILYDQVSLNDLNYSLTLGDSYAIVVEATPDADVSWWANAYTDTASGGTAGALPRDALNSGTGFIQETGIRGGQQQMEIITSPVAEPAPEPSTLALAGLGGLMSYFLFRRRSVSMPPVRRKKYRHVW